MVDRRDAFAGAAEIVLAIEGAARDEPAETVATAATLTVTPGAISQFPGQTRIGVDMRGIDGSSLDRLQRTRNGRPRRMVAGATSRCGRC